MLQLHEDKNFHYEAIRALALTRYHGGDIGEILNILPTVKAGDFDSWFDAWHQLGHRVLSTIDQSKVKSYSPITLQDVYFRASRYFFVADFFLHGNPSDPRIEQSYQLWREYFDKANALLPIPGKHATVKTPYGFEMPLIVYRAPEASASNPRPTLIVGGGFDSNYEELYHVFAIPAMQRGYNVVIYEGPGQPTLIRRQNKGFIFDWEKAVTPIVDHIFAHKEELSFIDTAKMGLIGYSLGGYLAARAAAFEPRLAAVICVDGVWSFCDAVFKVFPETKGAWESGDMAALTKVYDDVTVKSSSNVRWFHDHLKYSFCSTSIEEIYQSLSKMTMDGIADKIKMPAFIGEAEEDIFFLGQPAHIAQEIGPNATLFPFRNEQAAGEHCQSGALTYLNGSILEWFGGVVGEKNL